MPKYPVTALVAMFGNHLVEVGHFDGYFFEVIMVDAPDSACLAPPQALMPMNHYTNRYMEICVGGRAALELSPNKYWLHRVLVEAGSGVTLEDVAHMHEVKANYLWSMIQDMTVQEISECMRDYGVGA